MGLRKVAYKRVAYGGWPAVLKYPKNRYIRMLSLLAFYEREVLEEGCQVIKSEGEPGWRSRKGVAEQPRLSFSRSLETLLVSIAMPLRS